MTHAVSYWEVSVWHRLPKRTDLLHEDIKKKLKPIKKMKMNFAATALYLCDTTAAVRSQRSESCQWCHHGVAIPILKMKLTAKALVIYLAAVYFISNEHVKLWANGTKVPKFKSATVIFSAVDVWADLEQSWLCSTEEKSFQDWACAGRKHKMQQRFYAHKPHFSHRMMEVMASSRVTKVCHLLLKGTMSICKGLYYSVKVEKNYIHNQGKLDLVEYL